MRVPELRSARLTLTPLGFEHSNAMFALWSEPEVCRYSGAIIDAEGEPIPSPVECPSDSDRIIEFWLAAARRGTGCRWALMLAETGTFVGSAGFNTLGPRSEYAYHLMPDWWGRGLMSEATQTLLEWVVSAYACEQIELFIDEANERSCALARRHHFVLRGRGDDDTQLWTRTQTGLGV